jgi:hypothetical protein
MKFEFEWLENSTQCSLRLAHQVLIMHNVMRDELQLVPNLMVYKLVVKQVLEEATILSPHRVNLTFGIPN